MPEFKVPMTEHELVLKQISIDDLNPLGKAAMAHAFTGFATLHRFEASEIEKYEEELSSLAPGVRGIFDPSHFRRFAGDSLLSRGRYYTLADDLQGGDSGTLVRELRSYYNPEQAGIIQVFDSTSREDADVFRHFSIPMPGLAVIFLPFRSQPNEFAAAYSTEAIPMVVHLPLRIERRLLTSVVDLRDPLTAKSFAQELTQIEWEVQGVRTKGFILRPHLDAFYDLIPSLLEQSLGGGGLTNLIGTWLRKMGVQGLIFPSARVDASVTCTGNRVTRSSGWNFVDYSGASKTLHDVIFDLGNDWPSHIQLRREGPHKDMAPTLIPSVTIEYQKGGDADGSWRVNGLRAAREALWRFLKAIYCIDKVSSHAPQDSISLAKEWLLALHGNVYPLRTDELASRKPEADGEAERLGRTSMVVEEALIGNPQRIDELQGFIKHIAPSQPALAVALSDLLKAASSIG